MARNSASATAVLSSPTTFAQRMELSEMSIDEGLPFYDDVDDDASTKHCSFRGATLTASPQHMGLLLPEGSPRRFQIFDDNQRRRGHRKLEYAKDTGAADTQNTPSKTIRYYHSLSSDLGSMECSMEDEYMQELFEMETFEHLTPTRRGISTLFNGSIKHPATSSASVAPDTHFSRLTPKRSYASANDGFKRAESPYTNCSPKRFRSSAEYEKENLNGSYNAGKNSPGQISAAICTRPLLRKSMSLNDSEIMSALTRSESQDLPDLIGDFSKPYALPLLEGRHRDLKSISSDTLSRLIRGEFASSIDSYKIIDCRYPYEYDGGHILGAKNLYTQAQIVEEFLSSPPAQRNRGEHTLRHSIIIFHCEFSSERGPKLSRYLRNSDRARNTNGYPTLDYPELYLLHNGYKEFFETHPELCDPSAYRQMLAPAYNDAYRHFRAKSKSWNGDGGGASAATAATSSTRLKKSRSRLIL